MQLALRWSLKASNSYKMELKCLPLNALNTFCGLRLPWAAEGIGLPKSDACKGVALGPHPHSHPEMLSNSLCPGGNHTFLPRALYSNPVFFQSTFFTSWEGSSGGNIPRRLQRKLGAHSAASCPGSNFWGPQAAMGRAASSQWSTVIGGGHPCAGNPSLTPAGPRAGHSTYVSGQ